jgi:8-oxo-dGTP diphosphatase
MKKSTCIYLIRDGRWLMMLRNRKKNDVNHDKWIGVGGKCEGEETFEACAKREVKEETGLTVQKLDYAGLLLFEYEGKPPEVIAVYTSDSFEGDLKDCDEGTLAWIREEEILNLALWEGDRIFLEQMLAGNREPFRLRLVYDRNDTLIQSQSFAEGEVR